MSSNDTKLTDSDRFVADWLVEKITNLTDDQHALISGGHDADKIPLERREQKGKRERPRD